ncbi:hypothetical protein P8452_58652 [Trifolium repens]|nr:hypothetical protein P8452_58652 [Trifolium repens]
MTLQQIVQAYRFLARPNSITLGKNMEIIFNSRLTQRKVVKNLLAHKPALLQSSLPQYEICHSGREVFANFAISLSFSLSLSTPSDFSISTDETNFFRLDLIR